MPLVTRKSVARNAFAANRPPKAAILEGLLSFLEYGVRNCSRARQAFKRRPSSTLLELIGDYLVMGEEETELPQFWPEQPQAGVSNSIQVVFTLCSYINKELDTFTLLT